MAPMPATTPFRRIRAFLLRNTPDATTSTAPTPHAARNAFKTPTAPRIRGSSAPQATGSPSTPASASLPAAVVVGVDVDDVKLSPARALPAHLFSPEGRDLLGSPAGSIGADELEHVHMETMAAMDSIMKSLRSHAKPGGGGAPNYRQRLSLAEQENTDLQRTAHTLKARNAMLQVGVHIASRVMLFSLYLRCSVSWVMVSFYLCPWVSLAMVSSSMWLCVGKATFRLICGTVRLCGDVVISVARASWVVMLSYLITTACRVE